MDVESGAESPTTEGLLLCLRALAEEAATLNLRQTYSAIERAMRLAATEGLVADICPVRH